MFPNTFRVTYGFWSLLLIPCCRRIGIIGRAIINYCRWWVTSRYIHHITFSSSVTVMLSELVLVTFQTRPSDSLTLYYTGPDTVVTVPANHLSPLLRLFTYTWSPIWNSLPFECLSWFCFWTCCFVTTSDLFLSAEGFSKSTFDIKFLPNNSLADVIPLVDWGVFL